MIEPEGADVPELDRVIVPELDRVIEPEGVEVPLCVTVLEDVPERVGVLLRVAERVPEPVAVPDPEGVPVPLCVTERVIEPEGGPEGERV